MKGYPLRRLEVLRYNQKGYLLLGPVVWKNDPPLTMISRRTTGIEQSRPFLVFVVPRSNMASSLFRVLELDRNFDIATRFYEAPDRNE